MNVRQVLLSVAGTLGAAVATLGFVALVGAATWVARFRGAGISATYAVSLMPRNELLATGADQLYAPIVAAIFATTVAAVFFIVCTMTGVEGVWTWGRRLVLAGVIVWTVLYFERHAGNPFSEDNYVQFAGSLCALSAGAATVEALGSRVGKAKGSARANLIIAMLGTVLLTTLVFGAFVTYSRNLVHSEVRPAAVLRKHDASGLSGIYVGQNGDRIYVALIEPRLPGSTGPRSSARVIGVPRNEVADFSVGGVLRPGPAFDRIAEGLRADLIRQRQQRE